jgi:hypothetical protein
MALLVAGLALSATAQEEFDLQRYFDWKIAICYHPMYMLVDEDRGEPVLSERIPPWGAATAEQYMERVKRNLASLEKDPALKLNYEWAATSLEDVAARFPDVMERMQASHRRGQLEFVDGVYSLSQPMVHGSESGWRQFEYGTEIYRRLFGAPLKVYTSQECQLYPQLPQVLRHFGYEYMVMPSFPWAVRITRGPFEILGHEAGNYMRKGSEFIQAEAPDGTGIPTYFATNVRDKTVRESCIERDRWSPPPIWIDFPDLAEFHNPKAGATPVLLGQALAERVKVAPPRGAGEVRTYYTYNAEGVWAEAHARAGKEAEEMAVQAGNLLALARLAGHPMDKQAALDALWRKILKYQDHDATWIEVTDLRRKAIDKFGEAVAEARALMQEVAGRLTKPAADTVTVFNGLAHPRTALVEWTQGIPEGVAAQKVAGRTLGFCELPALGLRSFKQGTAQAADSVERPLPAGLKLKHYAVEFTPEGLVRKLTTAAGEVVVDGRERLGGELRAVLGREWADNRKFTARFLDGEVCAVVERTGAFGLPGKTRGIPVVERYCFFKHQPLIKVELAFDFNGDAVGMFHIDETKLNVYWPTAGGAIHHDMPFGYEKVGDDESILAPNWVHCGGLVYVNRGTTRHWVRDGVLANTLAWGGKDWSNRIHPDYWAKLNAKHNYDLNLYGRQTIAYEVIPFGAFDGPRVVRAVEDLMAPVFACPGAGQESSVELGDPNLAVTGLFEKGGEVWARGFRIPGSPSKQFRDWEIFNAPLHSLKGQR